MAILVLILTAALKPSGFGQCCPPIINTQPQSQTVTQGMTGTFTVGVSSGTYVTYQWRFNGNNLAGATNSALALTNAQAWQQGGYSVVASNAVGFVISGTATLTVVVRPGFIVGWGNGDGGQTTTPFGLTNVLAIAGGGQHSLALKADRTVVAWGTNNFGQATVPPGLTNVAAISAGEAHNVALKRDGTVVVWGDNTLGQTNLAFPLSNVVAISAGAFHSLALKSDGTVVAWGYNDNGQTDVPPGLGNVVAISGGGYHSLALTGDGTLVGWGDDFYNQIDSPAGLSNVVSIVSGLEHNVALTSQGTVAAWGGNYLGQSDVPAGLTNVVSVAAGHDYSIALRRDGTIATWGDNTLGQTNLLPQLTNAAAISSHGNHTLAIAGSGAVAITIQPANQQVHAGTNATFAVMAVGRAPITYRWRLNGLPIAGATNATYTRVNVQPADAGVYSVLVSNVFGAVISSNATLSIIGPPSVLIEPQSQTVVAGATASFNVTASGGAPLTYQWRFNGADIADGTMSSLALSNVQPTAAGLYRVVVSNSAGTVTSSDAILTVICPNQSQSVVGSAFIGAVPGQIAFNPNTDRLFLAGGFGQPTAVLVLTIFNKTNPEVLSVFAGGAGVAVNAAANRLYTSGGYNGIIQVHDATTFVQITNVFVGYCGGEFDVDPIHNLVYMASQCGGGNDPIHVLDGSDNAIVGGPLGSGGIASSVLVNPTTSFAYFNYSGGVRVFGPPPGFLLITNLTGVVAGVNPVTSRVYQQSGADMLVLDGVTHETVAIVSGGGGAFTGVNTTLNRLYVSDPAHFNVKVIDGNANKLIGAFSLGAGVVPSEAMCVDSAKSRIYIAGSSGTNTFLYVVEDNASPILSLIPGSTSVADPGALATDGTDLFIAEGASIWKMPAGGGAAAILYSNVSPCCILGLAQVGTNLYWIDPNGDPDATAIFRIPVNGTALATKIYSGFASGQPIVDGSGITSDGLKLYTADEYNGGVHRLNLDGSGITQLGPDRFSGGFATEHVSTVAVGGGMVYVADSGKDNVISPQVLKISAAGFPVSFTTVYEGAPLVRPIGIAVGNGKIYLADPGASNTVWQLPITGGIPTPVVCGAPFVQINGLTFFNNALYISDAGNVGNINGPGAIYKVDLSVRLTSPVYSANRFQFRLTGPAGTYVIQASTNLTSWTSLATTNLTNGLLDFTDGGTSNFVLRYYRAYAQ